jgi:hypothetical protein
VSRAALVVMVLATVGTVTGLDVFGYYEPQYTGTMSRGDCRQLMSNRLRVDLKSTAVENVEFGADVIGLLYHGTRNWNLLDLLPADVSDSVPAALRPLYALPFRDRFHVGDVYARLGLRRIAIAVGKQQVSFGTGYFANPTDIFNTKDAFDPTYEQPGHNALRIDIQPWNRVSLTGLVAPGADWRETTKLVRAKAGFGRFDLSVTGVEHQRTCTDFTTVDTMTGWFVRRASAQRMLGGDVVGQVWEIGLWAEGAYLLPDAGGGHCELIAGIDHTLDCGLYLMAEFHRNTEARADWRNFDLNDWLRALTGETRTLARDQAYAMARYQLTDLIGLGMMGIVSVDDGSFALVPVVDWNMFENVDFTLMANVAIGDEGKAYGSTLGSSGFLRCRVWF